MKSPFDNQPEGHNDPVDNDMAAEVMFIQGAIRAARNVKPELREKLMRDLSMALACSPAELEFLFEQGEDIDPRELYDFPDSERRRRVIRENRLDAAE